MKTKQQAARRRVPTNITLSARARAIAETLCDRYGLSISRLFEYFLINELSGGKMTAKEMAKIEDAIKEETKKAT